MLETDKKWLSTDWERSDQGILCFRILHEERNRILNQYTCLIFSEKNTTEIVTTEEISRDNETDRQGLPTKALVESDRKKSSAINNRAIVESNNTVEEKDVRKYLAKKEAEELARGKKTREKVIASTSVANDKARLYDPLGSLELYGVTCQVKRREKPAVEKLTKQSGTTAEIRIDDRKATEFEENIEMVQKNVQVFEHEIKKSAAVSEKNIQTNLRKSEKYKRHDKISHIDTKISRAAGLEKKEKKKERKERKQEKWIDKYKHKQR